MNASAAESAGPARTTPIRVLFLCTGNSARSQIAEALLTQKGGSRFVAASAGTSPAARVHPEAIAALARWGIEWSGHRPKNVDTLLGEPWDLVITVCDRARESCPVIPGRPTFAYWGVPDPAAIEDPERRAKAFSDTVAVLSWRLDLMLAIKPELFETMIGEQQLKAIGTALPTAETARTSTP
jgi:protein-tyrosine-phosphatase